jgi:hypothetical protein
MKTMIGSWAFLIGVILAIILGAIGAVGDIIALILVILGLIVGILNVSDKETNAFLMGGTVLVIVSAFGADALEIVGFVQNILNAILIMFVPATVVVAVKSVFMIAKK